MHYPVFLDLKHKPCVVVGGGSVAVRKVEDLLEAEADVTVVASRPSAPLEDLATGGRIDLITRPYREGDLYGAVLVISATDDRTVNRAVAEEAHREGALVNVVDAPDLCDFYVPAVLRRGSLVIAISTSGRSPALARSVREDLEMLLGPEYETALEVVHTLRMELRQAGLRLHPEEWQKVIHSVQQLLRQGVSEEEALHRVRAELQAEDS